MSPSTSRPLKDRIIDNSMVDRTVIRVFIQARMSSTRFPGKMLAPLWGRPVIAHVISQVAQVIPLDRITVATSAEQSDDPLACYVRDIGVAIYRGPLDDVFARFRLCLREYPCAWFFRICADSPLLDSALLQTMLAYRTNMDVDLVTSIFPVGKNAEMLNSATFAAIELNRLTAEEKEHLTKVYYNHPAEFRIINIESTEPSLAEKSFAVDTLEDLCRLERTLCSERQPPEKTPGKDQETA